MEKTKTCIQCNQTKPATLRFFNMDKRTYDHLTTTCCECSTIPDGHPYESKKYRLFEAWYEKNRAVIRSMHKRLVR